MVDITHKKCCGCNLKIPIFNYPEKTIGEYCASCKKDGMIDVITPKCLTPMCSTRASNKKYEGYCCRCFMYLFPEKPITVNYKTKEREVVKFVTEEFKDFTWICDKKITGGCSKRRPDLVVDFGDQVLFVEIDENQHGTYDCSCENKRIMELSQDVGHRPIICIRFNPDDYNVGTKHFDSCWAPNKKGLCSVKRNKKIEWNERLQTLKFHIDYWSTNKTDKTVEMIHLYFDS